VNPKEMVMMKISRDWATPLTIGSFALLSVTGVLMFFHLDSGLNKLAHEWLSWLLLVAVGLHLVSNWTGFRRTLRQPRGQLLIGAGVLALGLSFLPAGLVGAGSGEPPFVAPARALARAPWPVLAQVAGVSEAELSQRLASAGLPEGDGNSIAARVGPDTRRQIRVLGALFATGKAEGS
jgi:CDP-diglyceride synthetase